MQEKFPATFCLLQLLGVPGHKANNTTPHLSFVCPFMAGRKIPSGSSLLKDAKEGASAAVADILFHTGIAQRKKLNLKIEAVSLCRVLLKLMSMVTLM